MYAGRVEDGTGTRHARRRSERTGATLLVWVALVTFALLHLPADADAAAGSVLLAPDVGLFDQFGYAPAYTRNVPAFDQDGRAYLRSRSSSGNRTSYVHTLVDGAWVRLDFLTALRAAYPTFVETVGGGGLRSDSLVFDREDRAYNPITVRLRDGSTRNALLVSWDRCRTWTVFKLPAGTFVTERPVGHNEIDGPPFLALWRRSGPPDVAGSQTNALWVTQPRLEGRRLVLPPLVRVTDRCLGLSRDSGGASFAVTRAGTTWFVWSEAAARGGRGTPHYISSYDHAAGTTSRPLRLAVTPRRSDPHNKPGICLDSAGHLHVIAGGHGSPALYTRSLEPLSAVLGWTAPTPVVSTGWVPPKDPATQKGRQTYPAFVCDGRDVLHLVTRQWRRGVDDLHEGRGYGALVHQSCASQGAWTEPSVVVAGAHPGYAVFFHKLALDAEDRLFLSCSYQGGPELTEDRALRSSLAVLGRTLLRPGKYRRRMLLVSDDGGVSWRFAADADLDAPGRHGRRALPAAAAERGDERVAAAPPDVGWEWVNPLPQGNQFTDMALAGRRFGWAVGTHGTVVRTTDAGLSWATQSVPTTADLFGVAAVDARRAWIVGASGEILRTIDGGRNWRAASSGTTRDLFAVVAVSPRVVWAVGDKGMLLRSGNGGQTWVRRSSSTSQPLYGAAFAGRHGLICGDKGALLSTHDNGLRWKGRRSLHSVKLFAVALCKDGRAAAVGEGGALVLSTDRGRTWRSVRTGIGETLRAVRLLPKGRAWAGGERTVLVRRPGRRGWRAARLPTPGPCGALAVARPDVVLTGGAGGVLCRSTDGGRRWRALGQGPRSGWNDLSISEGQTWAVGADGRLLRAAADGVRRSRIADRNLRGLARHGPRGWAVGDDGTVVTSTDGGETWAGVQPPTDEDLLAVAAPAPDTVVVVGAAGTLLASRDGAGAWQAAHVTADDLHCVTFVDQAHGWAGGGATYGETRAQIVRTVDGGSSWRTIDLPVWGRIRDLCFIDALHGWAAVEDWGIDGDRPRGSLLATTDGGETWLPQWTSPVGLLAVTMGADGGGWACGERGLTLQTTDGGATWTARDAGTDSTLRAAGVTAGEAWLAGADGAILVGRPTAAAPTP